MVVNIRPSEQNLSLSGLFQGVIRSWWISLTVIFWQLLVTRQTMQSGIQVLHNKALSISSLVPYRAPVCTLPQQFLNFNAHTCSLGILLKCRFLFSKSGLWSAFLTSCQMMLILVGITLEQKRLTLQQNGTTQNSSNHYSTFLPPHLQLTLILYLLLDFQPSKYYPSFRVYLRCYFLHDAFLYPQPPNLTHTQQWGRATGGTTIHWLLKMCPVYKHYPIILFSSNYPHFTTACRNPIYGSSLNRSMDTRFRFLHYKFQSRKGNPQRCTV